MLSIEFDLGGRLDSQSNLKHFLPRKEVIQPHLPVRLPCYDFAPVIDLTLGAFLPAKAGLDQRLRVLPTSMA